MIWFVSTEIDTDEEFQKRMEFYSQLRKRELNRDFELESKFNDWCYIFNDGNDDNRFMLVGHTDFPIKIILAVTKSSKKRYGYCKFFICACIMSFDIFCSKSGLGITDEVYVSEQALEDIEGTAYYTCEFLDKAETRVGFKATKSELRLLNSEIKSFYGNLKHCFIPLNEYKDMGAIK